MYPTSTKDKATTYGEEAVETIKGAKNALVSEAREAAEDTRTHLRSVARETGAKVQDFFAHKKDQVQEVRGKAESTIKANPLTSAAAAFAGGMLVASLLKRR